MLQQNLIREKIKSISADLHRRIWLSPKRRLWTKPSKRPEKTARSWSHRRTDGRTEDVRNGRGREQTV